MKPEEERIKEIMKERGVDRYTAEQMYQVEIAGGDLIDIDKEGVERQGEDQSIDNVSYDKRN